METTNIICNAERNERNEQPTVQPTATKRCVKCGNVKPTSEFYRSKACSDGVGSYCKECRKMASKKRYAELSGKMAPTAVPENSSNIDPDKYFDERCKGLTPQDLITELRNRGYYGTLKYREVKVKVHTITI